MKKLLFFILTLTMSFNSVLGQDAAQAFKKAKKAFNLAATAENDKRAEKLEEARQQIDIATAGIDQFDEKTLPKVWLKSAEIYIDLAQTDYKMANIPGSNYTPQHPDASTKAYVAYTETLKTKDLKKYNKTTALDGLKNLWSILANEGNTSFNNKEYKKAYDAFTYVINIDNLLVENNKESIFGDDVKKNDNLFGMGLSAFAAQMYPEAQKIFEDLEKDNYERPDDVSLVYEYLYKVYKNQDQTDKSLSILEKGRTKYPEDERLRLIEIDHYLQADKLDDLTGKIEAAIQADPSNVNLYSTLGHVYDRLSQDEFKGNNDEKAQNYFDLALKNYTKALEIDGTHFNTIYNTGALYYNKAANVTRQLIEMEDDYSAEGLRKAEAKRAEMLSLFDSALPYFQRAEAVQPGDVGTLSALQEIYARKDNLEMVNEFKSRLEKVRNGGKIDTPYFK